MPKGKALICMPVSHKGYVVPGSILSNCSECGELVWVSPSSLLIRHGNPGMKILCIPCGLAQMKKDKHPEIANIIPAQAEEIQEYFNSR